MSSPPPPTFSPPPPLSSTPSTPHLQYSPLRSPLLESTQLPPPSTSSLDSPTSSRHTHIHIHSHSHFPPHPLLPPTNPSVTSHPSWLLTSSSPPSPKSHTSPYTRAPASRLPCSRRCGPSFPSSYPPSPCAIPVSVRVFLLICALAGFLLYQTHLCTLADTHPHSTLAFLHSTLHHATHLHAPSTPSTSSSSSLLSLSQLSSPSIPPTGWSSLLSSDFLLEPWQQRLLPVNVELEAGYAWISLNLALATGSVHSPPLYDGLPCIRVLPAPATADCVKGVMRLMASEMYSISVTPLLQRQSDSLTPADESYAPTAESGEWRWLSEDQIHHLLERDLPALLRANATTADGRVTLTSAVEAMANLILPVIARFRVSGLMEGRTYIFQVEVGNRTHRTLPILSLPVRTMSQMELFTAEQQRTSRYLNLITEPEGQLPPPLSPPLPFRSPVPISPHRQPAPFETIQDKCPAAFLSYVEEYRLFHARQVKRLRATKGEVQKVVELVSDPVDPVRVIVSGVYRWSGVTDRTSAFTGIYLMAMLTRRVLFLDEDWPDIQRVMLSPLTLSMAMVAPMLKDAELKNWTQEVEVTDVGPLTEDYDKHYSGPIVFITSIKGIIMRLLTESNDYSRTLQALGLTPDNVIGCVAHSLWTVRLSSLIAYSAYQPVLTTLLSPSTTAIAIQIRSWHDYVFLNQAKAKKGGAYQLHSLIPTDAMKEDRRRQVKVLQQFGTQGFFHCAQDWSDSLRLTIPATSNIIWYLVSDDEELRAAAISRWGKGGGDGGQGQGGRGRGVQLISLLSASMLGHSNAVDVEAGYLFLRHAVVEQWLFSLCEWAVVSQTSGYGRWPALLGLRGHRVFMLNNDQQNVTRKAAMTCMDEEKDGITILDLSKEWSKV